MYTLENKIMGNIYECFSFVLIKQKWTCMVLCNCHFVCSFYLGCPPSFHYLSPSLSFSLSFPLYLFLSLFLSRSFIWALVRVFHKSSMINQEVSLSIPWSLIWASVRVFHKSSMIHSRSKLGVVPDHKWLIRWSSESNQEWAMWME